MRRRTVSTLVLAIGLAVVPARPMAAEPGESELQAGEMGYVVARGSFDPAPLCADFGPTCSVVENQIALAEDVAIGKWHGAANYVVRWLATAYPECDPWMATVWMEFTGDGPVASEALGTVVALTDLDFDLGPEGTCQHEAVQTEASGVWQVDPLEGDKLRGEIILPGLLDGSKTHDFTLDATQQTEAPDGFFGQDGRSDLEAFLLSLFLEEAAPGL